jgi:hypothetical protein
MSWGLPLAWALEERARADPHARLRRAPRDCRRDRRPLGHPLSQALGTRYSPRTTHHAPRKKALVPLLEDEGFAAVRGATTICRHLATAASRGSPEGKPSRANGRSPKPATGWIHRLARGCRRETTPPRRLQRVRRSLVRGRDSGHVPFVACVSRLCGHSRTRSPGASIRGAMALRLEPAAGADGGARAWRQPAA